MKNKILLAFLAILFVGAQLPLRGFQKISVKEDVFVGKDEVQDNVIAFGGDITVEGRVRENVIAFGGSITISGEVGDSVVGLGSEVDLRSTAVIKGDLVSLGGTVHKEPGCVIQGDTVHFEGGEILSKLIRGGWLIFPPLVPLILVIKLIGFIIWLFIAVVVAALFPRQLAFASAQVRASFWPIVGTGLLALIIFSGLVIVAALLSLILIGIPFLLLLLGLGLVVKLFGQMAVFYFFGESVSRAFRNRGPTAVAAVVIGLVVVSFIKLVPILGSLFSLCLSFIGWGVVFRTKFGTTENWLRRKA
ncbi:MAG: hypothetical protein AB1715_04175 [Acidobacteriota bacterium]